LVVGKSVVYLWTCDHTLSGGWENGVLGIIYLFILSGGWEEFIFLFIEPERWLGEIILFYFL